MSGRRPGRPRARAGKDREAARVVWPPASRQSARAAIAAMMRERGLGRPFEKQARREAEAARAGVLVGAEAGPRRDLTDLATFTIDPASARDFDDAISAEKLAGGAVRVWVHIADVSAYVPEGAAVDLEARRRATSVYVPGGVDPMLPPALSSDACSLVPDQERLALTAELELHGAEVARASFYRSLIRSDARLDYEQVDRIFGGREPASEPWGTPLAAARTAAAALQRAREERGALVLDSLEPEFFFDERGDVTEIKVRTQMEAHRVIEHLMIAANESVARLLTQQRVPCLYRVHERPDPAAIVRLVEQLASLDVPTPPMPEHPTPAQAAELAGEISRLVEKHVRRTGRGRTALGSLVLRSLKQAYYSPRNIGHAGLRSPSYCHFTSPIRRYPDLVVHRALLSALGAGERPPRSAELAELGAWTSERERETMEVEREADDVASCFALERVLYEGGWDQSFAGEVVGLISAGAFVAFGAGAEPAGPPVFEGLLPARRLRLLAAGAGPPRAARRSGAGPPRPAHRSGRPPVASAGDWWELNELGTILRGQRSGVTLRLGDAIEVRVARVEPLRGRVDLLGTVPDETGG